MFGAELSQRARQQDRVSFQEEMQQTMGLLDDLPDNLDKALITTIEERRSLERLVRMVLKDGSVTPFVGAGLSVPFGLKSWTVFLRESAALSQDEEVMAAVEALLKADKYEEAAVQVVTSIGRIRFNDNVTAEFGEDRMEEIDWTDTHRAACYLPLLSPGPVVTTNFDSVLEHVYEDRGDKFRSVIQGVRINAAVQGWDRGDRILLKLHGGVHGEDARVLTQQEYAHAYGSADSGKVVLDNEAEFPLPHFLKQRLETRPFLFLGCSLVQDRTLVVIRAAKDRRIEETRHFAVVERPASGKPYNDRTTFLAEEHLIAPIYFPPGQFDVVPALLEYLVAKRNKALKRPPAAIPNIDSFIEPLLCDRDDHSSIFKANLRHHSGPGRVYLLPGERDGMHHSLIRRLVFYELKELSGELRYGDRVDYTGKVLGWERGGSEDYLYRHLLMNVYDLMGVYGVAARRGWVQRNGEIAGANLCALMDELQRPVVIVRHELIDSDWDGQARALLCRYIRYWQDLTSAPRPPDAPPLPQFFVFLMVHLPEASEESMRRLRLFAGHDRRGSIEKHLEQIRKEFAACQDDASPFQSLPALGPVPGRKVLEWLRLPDISKYMRTWQTNTWQTELMKQLKDFAVDKHYPMKTVEEALVPVFYRIVRGEGG